MTYFWLSFTDPTKPAGTQFLGVSIVEAPNALAAILTAGEEKCNPGGEVAFMEFELEDLPKHRQDLVFANRNRLMSRDELERLGFESTSDNNEIDEIVRQLKPQHINIIIGASDTDEFKKFPRAMGITAVNACRNRWKLIEAEDAVRGVWNYRLTPLGRKIKLELLARASEA